jgi:hypothetical protein
LPNRFGEVIGVCAALEVTLVSKIEVQLNLINDSYQLVLPF